MKGSKSFLSILGSIGLEADALIAIADTEMSLAESQARYAEGEYGDVTKASAVEANNKSGLNVFRFSDILYEYMIYDENLRFSDFNKIQVFYEEMLKQERLTNDKLRSQLGAVARERAMKHRQILGRPEQDDELAIRYAAQYMALPTSVAFIGASADNLIVLNYPTPNLKYLNLKPDLSRRDPSVAVVETVLERA